jgi:hypothetical protein
MLHGEGAGQSIYSVDEVFVTNGSPGVTYVTRDDHIESDIASRLSSKQKIIAVSGPSKAGKTVLVRRVVTETLGWQMVEVSIEDFWLTLAAQTGWRRQRRRLHRPVGGRTEGGRRR